MTDYVPFIFLGIATLIVVISAYAIGLPKLTSSTDRIATWGVVINFISALAAIAAGLGAFVSYQHTVETARHDDIRRSISANYERKIELLKEAKGVVAALVHEPDPTSERAENGLRRFWTLYYADLIGVEKRAVENAMVKLGSYFRKKSSGMNPEADLGDLSLALSAAVEIEIEMLREQRKIELNDI